MILKKTLPEATGLSEHDVREIEGSMHRSPVRKLVEYRLEERIFQELMNGPSEKPVTPEAIARHRGVIEGLQISLGILNRNIKPNTNSHA